MSEPGRATRIGALPLCTLAFVACAVASDQVPGAARWLAFDRAALARGELWRLFTGHLVHGSAGLAALDLAALALFGAWVERASRRLFGATLATSALVASAAILGLTDYARYVGSSALVSGLLVAVAVHLLRSPGRARERAVGWALLGLFAAKVGLELAGAWPAGLGALPPGHEPVAVAHLGGALGGAAAAARLERRQFPSSGSS